VTFEKVHPTTQPLTVVVTATGNKCIEHGVTLNVANQADYDNRNNKDQADDDNKNNKDQGDDDSVPNETERSYLLREKKLSAEPKLEPNAMTKEERSFAPGDKTPARAATPPRDTSATPPRRVTTIKSPPMKSPDYTMDHLSPAFANFNLAAGVDDNASLSVSSTATSTDGKEQPDEDGSEDKPFIEWQSIKYPERNRMFDSQLVMNMVRNNWVRPGIYTRLLIHAMDDDYWTASVPDPEKFPWCKDRALMVRGPAFDYYHRHPVAYHKNTKNCEAVKNAHEHYIDTCKSVEKGNPVEYKHYLLVFDEGVVLDASHFAGEATTKVQTMKQRCLCDDKSNAYGKNFRCVYAVWEIAFKHGGVRAKKRAAEVDKKHQEF